MSSADVNNGLIVPLVAQTLGGTAAAGAALALVFMVSALYLLRRAYSNSALQIK